MHPVTARLGSLRASAFVAATILLLASGCGRGDEEVELSLPREPLSALCRALAGASPGTDYYAVGPYTGTGEEQLVISEAAKLCPLAVDRFNAVIVRHPDEADAMRLACLTVANWLQAQDVNDSDLQSIDEALRVISSDSRLRTATPSCSRFAEDSAYRQTQALRLELFCENLLTIYKFLYSDDLTKQNTLNGAELALTSAQAIAESPGQNITADIIANGCPYVYPNPIQDFLAEAALAVAATAATAAAPEEPAVEQEAATPDGGTSAEPADSQPEIGPGLRQCYDRYFEANYLSADAQQAALCIVDTLFLSGLRPSDEDVAELLPEMLFHATWATWDAPTKMTYCSDIKRRGFDAAELHGVALARTWRTQIRASGSTFALDDYDLVLDFLDTCESY